MTFYFLLRYIADMKTRDYRLSLREVLERREMSMYKLAQDTGLAYSTLWKLDKGDSQGVSFDVLDKICLALECTPNDLFAFIGGGKVKTGKAR